MMNSFLVTNEAYFKVEIINMLGFQTYLRIFHRLPQVVVQFTFRIVFGVDQISEVHLVINEHKNILKQILKEVNCNSINSLSFFVVRFDMYAKLVSGKSRRCSTGNS